MRIFLSQQKYKSTEVLTWLLMLCATLTASGCIGGLGLKYKTDPELYSNPPHNAVTFWGHATCYIDIEGIGIVTDPVFEPSYATFHKRFISSPPSSAYRQTKIILISHAHHDHLSPKTLSRFSPDVKILCPIPSAKYLDEMKQQIITMRPGDTYNFSGGQIIAVAAHHPGYRYSLKARSDGRALGYVIRTQNQTLFYSGDSEYFEGFKQVGLAHKPGLAIINITSHLGTNDALRVIRDLGVRKVVPIHRGAYSGSNEGKVNRYHSELVDFLGTIWMPLQVGESCTLEGKPLQSTDPH